MKNHIQLSQMIQAEIRRNSMEGIMGEWGFVICGHGQNPLPEEVNCKQKETHRMRRSHLCEKSEENGRGWCLQEG